MKPKKIRVTKAIAKDLTDGKIYPVRYWNNNTPYVESDHGLERIVFKGEWEPVQEFNHGDPVWAWDDITGSKADGIYLCRSSNNKHHIVEHGIFNVGYFKKVQHRKPQITLQELADKADVNLDEVEIVD